MPKKKDNSPKIQIFRSTPIKAGSIIFMGNNFNYGNPPTPMNIHLPMMSKEDLKVFQEAMKDHGVIDDLTT